MRPETVLVAVMYVNNEIGTIQPIKEITKLVRWYKKKNDLKLYPLVYTDAIQATNYLDINVDRLGVDLMSLSGSKIYGPKSSGVLYIRDRKNIEPLLHGGDQEFGLRAGTEDVAQIVGFTKALEITRSVSERECDRLGELQKYFFELIKKSGIKYQVNGSVEYRIPNNINISIPHVSSERLVIELGAQGICAASKSACREQDGEDSYVIAAIRKNISSNGSIRFTMGRSTTKRDVEKTVKKLVEIVKKIRTFEKSL